MPKDKDRPKRLLCRKELEHILGVSTSTLYRMEKKGDLPPRVQISTNRVGWRSEDVERFLTELDPADPSSTGGEVEARKLERTDAAR